MMDTTPNSQQGSFNLRVIAGVAKQSLCIFVLIAFLSNIFGPIPSAQAQDFKLPVPGVMVHLSPPFDPPILKGIKVYSDNPFRFDFILDQGDSSVIPAKDSTVIPAQAGIQHQEQLKTEATKLIKYFLASLTIPEKDLWVNLSPYEKNRIIPQSFGLTEMGRDLLAEDYMLKQITASLIYPGGETGKKFWKRVYEEAAKRYGTTNIPVSTFNKVWIVPEKAVVYENAKAETAYVVESKLKVMLEQDYLSMSKHADGGVAERGVSPAARNEVRTDGETRGQDPDINKLGSDIVREIVIPELTKEVNEDKNFAQLRQVYNSLILATWYKKKIKNSILEQVYADKNKVAGVGYKKFLSSPNENSLSSPNENSLSSPNENSLSSPNALIGDPEYIYQQYLKAFKKGVYNFIKEEPDPLTQELIPRKYFSGGTSFYRVDRTMTLSTTPPENQRGLQQIDVDLAMAQPAVSTAPAWYEPGKIIQHPFPNGIPSMNQRNGGVRSLLEDIKRLEKKRGWPAGTIVVTGGAVRRLIAGKPGLNSSDIDILIGLKGNASDQQREGGEILNEINIALGIKRNDMDINQQHTWHWNGGVLDYIGFYHRRDVSLHSVLFVTPYRVEPISSMWLDSNGTLYDPFGGVKDLLIDKKFRLVGLRDDWTSLTQPTDVLRAVRFKFEFGLTFDGTTQNIVDSMFNPRKANEKNKQFWNWFGVARQFYDMLQSGKVDPGVINAYRFGIRWTPRAQSILDPELDKILKTRDISIARQFFYSRAFAPTFKKEASNIIRDASDFKSAERAVEYLDKIGFGKVARVAGIDFNELLKQRPDYSGQTENKDSAQLSANKTISNSGPRFDLKALFDQGWTAFITGGRKIVFTYVKGTDENGQPAFVITAVHQGRVVGYIHMAINLEQGYALLSRPFKKGQFIFDATNKYIETITGKSGIAGTSVMEKFDALLEPFEPFLALAVAKDYRDAGALHNQGVRNIGRVLMAAGLEAARRLGGKKVKKVRIEPIGSSEWFYINQFAAHPDYVKEFKLSIDLKHSGNPEALVLPAHIMTGPALLKRSDRAMAVEMQISEAGKAYGAMVMSGSNGITYTAIVDSGYSQKYLNQIKNRTQMKAFIDFMFNHNMLNNFNRSALLRIKKYAAQLKVYLPVDVQNRKVSYIPKSLKYKKVYWFFDFEIPNDEKEEYTILTSAQFVQMKRRIARQYHPDTSGHPQTNADKIWWLVFRKLSDLMSARKEDLSKKHLSEHSLYEPRDITHLMITDNGNYTTELLNPPEAVAANGGIDLTPAKMKLQTQNAGAGIKFHLDPAQLAQLQNAPGFVPVIINIQPLKSLQEFLGLGQSSPKAASL